MRAVAWSRTSAAHWWLKSRILVAVPVVVEAALFVFYWREEALFHWFVHFFVGTSTALVAMAVVAASTRRPVARPAGWVVAAHLYAMFPDFLIAGRVPHEQWMNVFLGHVAVHYLPGRAWSWYGIFLAALAAYLIVLDSRVGISYQRRIPATRARGWWQVRDGRGLGGGRRGLSESQ